MFILFYCLLPDAVSASAPAGKRQHSGGPPVTGCSLLLSAVGPHRPASTNGVARCANAGASDPETRLDVGRLESRTSFYFAHGLASSTQRTYKSGENRYFKFCNLSDCSPLPVCESVLCKFVTYMADESLQYRTIKVYLSGLRFCQIRAGLGDPFQGPQSHMPRLEYVLKGVKHVQAQTGGGGRARLPITPAILRKLKGVWVESGGDRDTKLIWAACCLCFFAFLRAGEMTTPDKGGYDPAVHLSFEDVAIDDPQRPSFVRLTLKQSKTDPFRKGVDLYVGRTGSDLSPVAALLSYLLCRGSTAGPLFVFASGRPLTRKRFVELVRAALARTEVDQRKYCGHSFRIGVATTAAAKGVEDSVIKTLAGGRVWRTCNMFASRGSSLLDMLVF